MSFHRITSTGSIRSSLNRLARAARATSSASSSVRDVVDRERERDEVLPVVRRHEHRVRVREQLRHDVVGLVLEVLDVLLRRPGRPAQEPLLHGLRDRDHPLPRLVEQSMDLTRTGTEADPHQKIAFTGNQTPAATSAAAGMVSTQANTMFPATPQRTAESRRVAPAPITAPETTCVVESG